MKKGWIIDPGCFQAIELVTVTEDMSVHTMHRGVFYFTECQHGVEYDKSGVDLSTNEGSGGPAPGILCCAGSGIATPSIPTLQEPPSAACYASCVTWRAGASAAEAAGVGKGAAGLRMEDCRWRSSGTGRQTRRARMRRMPEPARLRRAMRPFRIYTCVQGWNR